MAGIYIHIPFCRKRCIYCAFYSTLKADAMQRYTGCVCRELELRGHEIADGAPYTVYFGGGTPSCLSLSQLERIVEATYIITHGNVSEMTVECNPDDLSAQYAAGLRSMGFNRISMGIQTFNDHILEFLGRRHDCARAIEAVRNCRNAGFDNISIDLMYGLPGQTLEMQRCDLETATRLDVQHISSYCLSFEEGSPLWKLKQLNRVVPSDDDDLCRDMYLAMCDHLHAHGFEHYEISNFCRPGFHSRHNSSYWNGTPYLGIGPSAHSFNGKCRRWNVSDLEMYMSGIEKVSQSEPEPDSIAESEVLTHDDTVNENIMLSLRTVNGLDLQKHAERFGPAELARLEKEAGPLLEAGFLKLSDGNLIIPEEQWFVSDGTISSLFV